MQKLPDFLKQYALRYPSDFKNSALLAASTAEDIDVANAIAAGASCAILSCDQNFYVQTDGNAAAVPTDISNGTASELNMTAVQLRDPVTGVPIAKLSVISESVAHITASFYN